VDAIYTPPMGNQRVLSMRSTLGVCLLQLIALIALWFLVAGPGPYYETAEAAAPFAGVLVFAVLGGIGVLTLRSAGPAEVPRYVLMAGTGLTIFSFVLFALLCVIVLFGSFP
jgi:hypothetical protein